MRKCIGYYNPYKDLAGFCIPVFSEENSSCIEVQELRDEIICAFEPADHLAGVFIAKNFEATRDVNDEAFYVFALGDEIFWGDKVLISDIIRDRIEAFYDIPHLLRDIGRFLCDPAIEDQGWAAIDQLLHHGLKGYRILDVSVKSRPNPKIEIAEALLSVKNDKLDIHQLIYG